MFPIKICGDKRKNKIISFLTDEDSSIAVLLAASHFEWTTSRLILFCGKSSVSDIQMRLKHCHGLKMYGKLWESEISTIKSNQIEALSNEVKNWNDFSKAFELRHILIHGRTSCTKAYAEIRVNQILIAIDHLYDLALKMNLDIHSRLDQRKWKKRTSRAS